MWKFIYQPIMRSYYRRAYSPEPLVDDFVPIPDVFRLNTVPWIATRTPVCQSTALQMIASHHGIDRPRRYFDFLMGLTYGARDMPGMGFFPVGTDPEVGLKEAAPYLGLCCRYLVTNDQDLFISALRQFLARQFPVRVPLDMGTIYGAEELIPHNEVLIGYDSRGFEYYEPVCRHPAGCRPVHMKPGEIGLYVENDLLIEAVEKETTYFHYPWRFVATILETGPMTTDLRPLWKRNGNALIGGNNFGTHYGAAAICYLVDQIEKEGTQFNFSSLALPFEIAAYCRCDNAACMHELDSHNGRLPAAATCFENSSRCFEACRHLVRQGVTKKDQIQELTGRLREAAEAETTAGRIFLEIAKA